MDVRLLMRAKRLAQNPPSARMVVLGLAVIGLSVALVAVERSVGWPDVLTLDRARPPAVQLQP